MTVAAPGIVTTSLTPPREHPGSTRPPVPASRADPSTYMRTHSLTYTVFIDHMLPRFLAAWDRPEERNFFARSALRIVTFAVFTPVALIAALEGLARTCLGAVSWTFSTLSGSRDPDRDFFTDGRAAVLVASLSLRAPFTLSFGNAHVSAPPSAVERPASNANRTPITSPIEALQATRAAVLLASLLLRAPFTLSFGNAHVSAPPSAPLAATLVGRPAPNANRTPIASPIEALQATRRTRDREATLQELQRNLRALVDTAAEDDGSGVGMRSVVQYLRSTTEIFDELRLSEEEENQVVPSMILLTLFLFLQQLVVTADVIRAYNFSDAGHAVNTMRDRLGFLRDLSAIAVYHNPQIISNLGELEALLEALEALLEERERVLSMSPRARESLVIEQARQAGSTIEALMGIARTQAAAAFAAAERVRVLSGATEESGGALGSIQAIQHAQAYAAQVTAERAAYTGQLSYPLSGGFTTAELRIDGTIMAHRAQEIQEADPRREELQRLRCTVNGAQDVAIAEARIGAQQAFRDARREFLREGRTATIEQIIQHTRAQVERESVLLQTLVTVDAAVHAVAALRAAELLLEEEGAALVAQPECLV